MFIQKDKFNSLFSKVMKGLKSRKIKISRLYTIFRLKFRGSFCLQAISIDNKTERDT